MQENERIRAQIIQRDRMAQELREKARVTIENNLSHMRATSKSPRSLKLNNVDVYDRR